MHDRDVLFARVQRQAANRNKRDRQERKHLSSLAAALAVDRVRLAAKLARRVSPRRVKGMLQRVKGARKRLKQP